MGMNEHCLHAYVRDRHRHEKRPVSSASCEERHEHGRRIRDHSFRVIGVWCVCVWIWHPTVNHASLGQMGSQIGRTAETRTGGGAWLAARSSSARSLPVGGVGGCLVPKAPFPRAPGVAPMHALRPGPTMRGACRFVARVWFMDGTLFCLSAATKAVSLDTTVSMGTNKETASPNSRQGNEGTLVSAERPGRELWPPRRGARQASSGGTVGAKV